MAQEKVSGRVIDGHNHIGEMEAWAFYDLTEPVKPTVFEYKDGKDYLKNHLDRYGIERAMVIPNYGIPKQDQPFSLNPVALDAARSSDRLSCAVWVSFMGQNKEMTMEALKLAGEEGVKALKTTFLLGGSPNPADWDDAARETAEACLRAAEEHDLVFHFHTSPGGASDISNYIPLIEEWGKRIKMYLVHFGGGVSGHIKLVPKFLDWVEQGYNVYTDVTWSVGFGPRWLMTEIEKRGVGHDRVLFSSDVPWSDFWGEYYKIVGQPGVSRELLDRILFRNYEQLYGDD